MKQNTFCRVDDFALLVCSLDLKTDWEWEKRKIHYDIEQTVFFDTLVTRRGSREVFCQTSEMRTVVNVLRGFRLTNQRYPSLEIVRVEYRKKKKEKKKQKLISGRVYKRTKKNCRNRIYTTPPKTMEIRYWRLSVGERFFKS